MKHFLFCATHLEWNDAEVPIDTVGNWLLTTKAMVELDVHLWRAWLAEHEDCAVVVKGKG